MPALRDADPDTLLLADGFNCRTQIRDLADDSRPMHLVQVLAHALADLAITSWSGEGAVRGDR